KICVHGLAADRTIWNAACHNVPGDGTRKSRHSYVGSGEESGRTATKAHRADDPFFPACAVYSNSWTSRHQSDGAAIIRAEQRTIANKADGCANAPGNPLSRPVYDCEMY